MRRFAAAGLLMLAVLATGFVLVDVRDPDVYTVSGLLHALPVDEDITVRGTVTAVETDYRAESGTVFQRFYIGDGEREVLVFCDTRRGRVPVEEGVAVTVRARFVRFDRFYELETACADGVTVTGEASRTGPG